MFTKSDLLYYFEQLQKIEKQMHETYRNLQEEVTHPEYKAIFSRLASEEEGHDALIQGLKNLLS